MGNPCSKTENAIDSNSFELKSESDMRKFEKIRHEQIKKLEECLSILEEQELSDEAQTKLCLNLQEYITNLQSIKIVSCQMKADQEVPHHGQEGKTDQNLDESQTCSQDTSQGHCDQLKRESITDQEQWRKGYSCLRDPGHDQLKREGITDQSMRKTTNEKIVRFFMGEYDDIIESQLKANNDDDFQTDEILTKHMKEYYDHIKKVTVEEACVQIYELFTYDPKKKLAPEEEERLTDISHAYGLLLYHRKKKENDDSIKILQEKQNLDSEMIEKLHPHFWDMVNISPPFVLFIPEQCDDTIADEFVNCSYNKTHDFHIRRPVILNNYLGTCCVKGLICKGSTNVESTT